MGEEELRGSVGPGRPLDQEPGGRGAVPVRRRVDGPVEPARRRSDWWRVSFGSRNPPGDGAEVLGAGEGPSPGPIPTGFRAGPSPAGSAVGFDACVRLGRPYEVPHVGRDHLECAADPEHRTRTRRRRGPSGDSVTSPCTPRRPAPPRWNPWAFSPAATSPALVPIWFERPRPPGRPPSRTAAGRPSTPSAGTMPRPGPPPCPGRRTAR